MEIFESEFRDRPVEYYVCSFVPLISFEVLKPGASSDDATVLSLT